MLDKEQMAALLGRSLTTVEDTNFDKYLDIATEHLEELLCCEIAKVAEDAEPSERTFGTRDGYRTVWVDPFSSLTSVKINGEVVDTNAYAKKQNDNLNGSWFNIIEFSRRRCGENITVEAVWGFATVPADLEMLLAQLFNQVSVDQKSDGQVKSKKIEDFSVTYKDSATLQDVLSGNAATIQKYSQCNQGAIRHGRVHSVYHR